MAWCFCGYRYKSLEDIKSHRVTCRVVRKNGLTVEACEVCNGAGKLKEPEFVDGDETTCTVCCGRGYHEWAAEPSPYCQYGHRSKETCDCGPIADNE